MNNKTTTELDVEISKSNDIKSFLNSNEQSFNEKVFNEFINSLRLEKCIEFTDMILKSTLSKSSVYELFNYSNNKKPKRNSVLQLSLVMTLTIEETNRLLRLSGNGELYSKRKRDSIIIFCINNNKTVIDTNLILEDEDLELL